MVVGQACRQKECKYQETTGHFCDKVVKSKYGRYIEREIYVAKRAVQYNGRYSARAAIAEYRIISYKGEMVKFWYKDKKQLRSWRGY